ncbi:MAG TPA: choice-of-anchor Q domain-containing protein [Chthoniobacterales bacterium]|nr:choice-of-anchor Q domain-containing protein [Chthoniobacterales bacterium]
MKRFVFSFLIAAGLIFASPQSSRATNWQTGDVITYGQAGWGTDVQATSLLEENFSWVYSPSGGTLEVGTGFSTFFDSGYAVEAYLPSAGVPGPFNGSLVDPTSTSSGVFGGSVTALHLDVDFSDAGFTLGNSGIPFGNLIVTNLTGSIANFNGQTVRQVLASMDIAIGGGQTTNTFADLDNLAENLAGAFDPEYMSSFAQNYLAAPPITTRTVSTLNETGPGSIRDIYLHSSHGDTINFAVTGTITLSTLNGPILIDRSLHIVGPGARSLTISGNANRVFVVTGGTSTISGLTIANGSVPGRGNDGSAAQGGAIYVSSPGMLTITNCAFSSNDATGATNPANGGNGGAGQGGAIYNGGTLALTGCTFWGNSATGNAGNSTGIGLNNGGTGGAGQGGALFNDTSGTLSVTNCTFNLNAATGGASGSGHLPIAGGQANGGAIFNQGTLTIASVTVNGNSGQGGAGGKGDKGPITGATGSGNGGISSGGGTSTFGNTLVAGNSGNTSPDVEGSFTSSGYNLIGKLDGSSGFSAGTDQVGTIAFPLDPKLNTNGLQYNGGQTETILLQIGSPAIDKGKNLPKSTHDQRGKTRPYDDPNIANAFNGDGNDIGAVEMQASELATATPTPTPTPVPNVQITVTTNPSGLSFTVDNVTYTSSQTFSWQAGSSHTISTTSPQTAETGVRYLWSSWSDSGNISHTVAPTKNKTYTANFTKQFFLTMSAGTGATVSPASGWQKSGAIFSISATATNNGSVSYSFTGWAGSGTGSYSGSNNPVSITMNGPITESANFVQNPVQVTVQPSLAGPTFSVDGTTFSSPQSFSWQPGSSHTIATTSPQSAGTGVRYTWSSWSDSGAISHTVTATKNKTYSATFTKQYFLTMNAGTGGTVSPASGWKNSGATVSITATPGSGHTFMGWTGSGTGSYSGTINPESITIGGPISETAAFSH